MACRHRHCLHCHPLQKMKKIILKAVRIITKASSKQLTPLKPSALIGKVEMTKSQKVSLKKIYFKTEVKIFSLHYKLILYHCQVNKEKLYNLAANLLYLCFLCKYSDNVICAHASCLFPYYEILKLANELYLLKRLSLKKIIFVPGN